MKNRGFDAFGRDIQKADCHRQFKAPRPAGTGIEEEYAFATLDMRLMRVSVENCREARRGGIEAQRAEIVQKVEVLLFEKEHVGHGQATARPRAVNVASDGVNRSYFSEFFENGVFADVAEMQDVVDGGKRRDHFGAEEPMSVTHDTDLHSLEPKRWYHFFARGFSPSAWRNGSTIWRKLPGFFGSSMARQ